MRAPARSHVFAVGFVGLLVILLVVVVTTAAGHRNRIGSEVVAGVRPPPAGPTAGAAPAQGKTPSTGRGSGRPTAAPAEPRSARPTSAQSASSRPTSLSDQDWDMVPLPDLSPYNDAVIKNSASSTHELRVCRSWSDTTCAKSSPRGDLKPGEDSATKFGWKDTDGFDRGDGWVQQHGCFHCVVTVTSE